jgi:DNA primase
MPADFNDDSKEQVRQLTDIVDLTGQSIHLLKRGRIYVGLCPWHDDERPSMQVDPQRQTWKCWVCDIGGDIFSFVMQREGVDFRAALEILAETAGVQLSGPRRDDIMPGSANDKKTLYAAAAWAKNIFHRYLLHHADAQIARDYFAQRGITQESLTTYQVGFAPNRWDFLANQISDSPYSPEVLKAVALLGHSTDRNSYYDFFRGRVLFPIHDTQNRTVAFGGRILPQFADDRAAKYVNSPETLIFSKSEQLYGIDISLDAIRKGGKALVMEGYTDVIVANQYGVTNVVAVLGTAINDIHVQHLKRIAQEVTLVLDGDDAGRRRANEVLQHFVKGHLDLRILTLPNGLDPCDYLQTHGTEAFFELVGTSVDALQHKVNIELLGINPAVDTHKSALAIHNILSTLAMVPRDQTISDVDYRRREQLILGRLGRSFSLPADDLRQQLSTIRRDGESRNSGGTPEKVTPNTSRPDVLDATESEILELLVSHPELTPGAVRSFDPFLFRSANLRSIFEFLAESVNQGDEISFDQLLLKIDDPTLKFVLVQAAENAKNKESTVQLTPTARLESLIEKFQRETRDGEERETIRKLHNNEVTDDEEMRLLQQLLEQQRLDRGLSE